MNETVVLKEAICKLEIVGHVTMTIDDLSQTYGIKRRGLYEFVSICCVFGICRRSSSNSIEWLGLAKAAGAVASIRERALAEPDSESLFALFDYSGEASLPRNAEAVVRLFFSAGLQSLDLRKVAKLFSQGKAKYKTMLRKLYTVVVGLELCGVVGRTAVVSEVRLNPSLAHPDPPGSQFTLSAILNSKEKVALTIGSDRRKREYEQISIDSVYDAEPVTATLDGISGYAGLS
jgi:hypothetical protein